MAKSTTRRPLAGLLLSQFFGAFNDNAWKLMVFTLATRALTAMVGDSSIDIERESQFKATLSLLLFLVPMLLFSVPAGAFADRLSKRSLIIGTKIAEVVLMTGATLSLLFAPASLLLPYALLALMGAQSALFAPAKYGVLPEVLPTEKLSRGNGLLEMWTMLAIIGGTGLGPVLLAADGGGLIPSMTWFGPFWLTVLSLIGLMGAFAVPRVKPARETPIAVTQAISSAWHAIRRDRILLLAIIGNILYWSVLSLLGQNVLVYAKSLVHDLAKGELLQGIPPASFGIGIAFGALLGGRMSGNRIEYGLIPLGAIGFAISSLLLGLLQPAMIGTLITLILMGTACGALIVPLHAIVQVRAPNERRGSIIALGNIFDITGMITGSLLAAGMAWIGLSLKMMLIGSAATVILATIWAVRLLPAALIRVVFLLLTYTLYKIRVVGAENIPKKGPALITANHVSLIDALFITAVADRPVRFVMNKEIYETWWVKPFASVMRAIPISSTSGPKAILEGLRQAGEALAHGDVVCIFPEGQITRTGVMQPFQRGVEVIMRGRSCPIIPVHLDHVWGSVFSFESNRFFMKWPRKIPYPITISVGEPLDPQTTCPEIRQAIKTLECDAWISRKPDRSPIHYSFIKYARQVPWRLALADENTAKVSYFSTLTQAVAVARALRDYWDNQPHVGILLPSSIPAVITNLAATISGHAVVNLNFTTGKSQLESAVEQAQLKTVVTSRQFLEKLTIELPTHLKPIFLEDIVPSINLWHKCTAALLSLFAPIQSLEKACGATHHVEISDILTIIFTSGSTGEPKGVVLSHFNIDSNVEGVAQVARAIEGKDKLLGILPLFHSFGYMTFWLGLNHNLGLVLHPNPLEGEKIGKLTVKYKITIIMTTPTFLKVYTRRVAPGQLGSLRCILTGAEKLPEKLSDAFEERFGIRPIEGYGATECSPVIATSTPDVRIPGTYQAGSAKGSVGQPLPGVKVRVVDPDTFKSLPANEAGMLLVRGPNVMQGYLGRDDLTQKTMHQDWYITGDIATIDPEGYIRITDRLSRFSKIGGEMVPHGRIEDALHDVAETNDQVFAVTAIPDDLKGERLVVLYTLKEDKIPAIHEKLSHQGLPNLFIPRLDHFIHVKDLPMLGTGKLDLKGLRTIALEQKGS